MTQSQIIQNGYSSMKDHFDKLILGGYPANTGLEPIRTTYEKAFDTAINLIDVYESSIEVSTNPVQSIITLVGDPENDIPTGLIATGGKLAFVSHVDNSIFKPFSDERIAKSYIEFIYNAMLGIVKMDILHKSDREADGNPYLILLKAFPLYFTFHHIKTAKPELLKFENFEDIFEKYIANSTEDAVEIFESLNSKEYTRDIDLIYSAVTSNNTVCLFW